MLNYSTLHRLISKIKYMQKHVYAILLSVLLGHAYYQMMEASNCSYMAAPMTDYLAFLWGFILVGYGFKYDNAVLTVLGASIVVEHIFQYMRKV
jgi:hypothetical protein